MSSDNRYKSDIPSNATERIVDPKLNLSLRKSEKLLEYIVAGAVVGTRLWDESGKLTLEIPYKDGLVHGAKYRWYFDGVLISEEPYVHGKRHGVAKQWSLSGELIGTYKMVHGTGIDLWWDSSDESDDDLFLAEVYYMSDGLHHGYTWWINDDQKSVWIERHYWYDELHGVEREWNEYGRLCRGYPRYYVNGEKVDKRRYLRAAESDETLPRFVLEENLPLRTFPAEVRKHFKPS